MSLAKWVTKTFIHLRNGDNVTYDGMPRTDSFERISKLVYHFLDTFHLTLNKCSFTFLTYICVLYYALLNVYEASPSYTIQKYFSSSSHFSFLRQFKTTFFQPFSSHKISLMWQPSYSYNIQLNLSNVIKWICGYINMAERYFSSDSRISSSLKWNYSWMYTIVLAVLYSALTNGPDELRSA